jgi:hypothetical protein
MRAIRRQQQALGNERQTARDDGEASEGNRPRGRIGRGAGQGG